MGMVRPIFSSPPTTARSDPFSIKPGTGTRWTTIVLRGAPGNLTAIGARLEIATDQGRTLIREVRAGGSYLAQSTARQFVALPTGEFVESITVRGPRGESAEVNLKDYFQRIEIGRKP